MVRSLVILFIICQLTFAIWPGLDIVVSGLFYDAGQGFWLSGNHQLERIRNGIIGIFASGFFWAVGGILITYIRKFENGLSLRKAYEVVVLAYIFGAGVLVNSILKSYWGRARPADIDVFGGTRVFTPPFQITDQCATNCSFVSGEGSAVTTLFFGVCLMVWVVSGTRTRMLKWGYALVSLAGGIAVLGLALRLMTGRHFLSDTLFAILFIAFTYVGLLSLPRYRNLVPLFGPRR